MVIKNFQANKENTVLNLMKPFLSSKIHYIPIILIKNSSYDMEW